MKKHLILSCCLSFLALKGINCANYELKTDSLPQTQYVVQKSKPKVKKEVSEPKIKKNPAKIKKEIKTPKQTQPKPKKPLELLLEDQPNINNILEKSLDLDDEVLNYNLKKLKNNLAKIEIYTYDGNNVSKYHGKVRLSKDGKVKLKDKQLNLVKKLKKQTFTTENTSPFDILTNLEYEIKSEDKTNKANQSLDSLLDKAVKSLKSLVNTKNFVKKDAEMFVSGINTALMFANFYCGDVQHLLTDGLINKKLDCDLLSLFYKGVEERLGLPEGTINLVKVPGHVFVRFKLSDNSYVNIETLKGKIVDDNYYKRKFKMHEDSIKNNVFMKNLTKKEIKGLIYNNIGLSLYFEKSFDKAIKFLNKAVNLYPKLTDAHNHKGLCLHELNSLDKALKCFDKTIELDPFESTAFNHKGNSYFAKNDFEKAIECYNDALKHCDKNDPYYAVFSKNKKLAEKYLNK